jgi:hypothetical protein
MKIYTRTWRDIGWRVEFNAEKFSHAVEFVARYLDDDQELSISGSVKWDGCSNFTFADECFHFCSRDGMENIGQLLARIYDMSQYYLEDKSMDRDGKDHPDN